MIDAFLAKNRAYTFFKLKYILILYTLFIFKVRNFNPEIVTAHTSKSCLSEPGTFPLASTSTTVS
jgi:hypothetical protein